MQSTYDSLLRTALALQHLAHVRLTVRASNQIDNPRLSQRTVETGISIYQPRPTPASHNDRPAAFDDSIDLSYSHQTSSCISTTRPTPATLIEHPAVHIYDSTIPAIDITHLVEGSNTTATDFTHTFVNLTINCRFSYICYPAFVSFIVFGCQLLTRIKLKSFAGSMCLSAPQQASVTVKSESFNVI